MPGTVFFVSKSSALLRATEGLLRSAGYHVLCARDTGEFPTDVSPGLLILDVPDDMTESPAPYVIPDHGVPVLFLGSWRTPAGTVRRIRTDGDGFLAKPYLADTFLMEVERLLRGRE